MSRAHAGDVGRLHAECIAESGMSDLGPRFLAALYRSLLETGFGVGYVMLVDGRVAGFAFGRSSHELTMGGVIRASFARLAPRFVAASLARPAAALRALRGLGAGGHVVCEPGVGELLSIAVAPEARGGKGGARVLDALFERLAREGCRAVRWETLGSNARAQAFYRRIGAHLVRETEVGGKANLWFEKDLQASP